MDIYSTRERIRKENINFMNLPLRVTFYARVSTDFNVQLNSLDNQITYYTDFIRKNPNWEYVDGYVDEGISGYIRIGNMLTAMLTRAYRAYRPQSVSDSTK